MRMGRLGGSGRDNKSSTDAASLIVAGAFFSDRPRLAPKWNPNSDAEPPDHGQALEKADPGRDPSGRLEIWDTYLPGFGYRATQRGKGSFFVMYGLKGQRRRMTVGRYPVLSLAEARDLGKRALSLVQEGTDPEEHVAAKRAAEEVAERERRAAEEQAQKDADHRRFERIVAEHISKHHRGAVRGNTPKNRRTIAPGARSSASSRFTSCLGGAIGTSRRSVARTWRN